MGDITGFSWQQDAGWTLISVSARHQHDEIDIGLCQGLDWREVMSWYAVDGASSTTDVITQQESSSIDAPSWWQWDLGGFVDDKLIEDWSGIQALRGPFMVG